ncbi:glycosyl transferase [Methyloprofundus sedimenti]|uniref:Glycosyl transferase n=1 Tax=Methyloprofundus sedimenti TaxID=1420851 RepID=A0A1V8M6A9_9GAMM|nr:glycosyltransferase [Methyloprofundus sedimenti]OQK17038.1 glycosyl transferase [Methyloprofundus sedimenti]
MTDRARIGAVVIGRNEGQRLVTCLQSLVNSLDYIVYVDSGSNDSSLHEAESLGVATISLNMSIPFTAARARNEGAQYLLSNFVELDYIQFIDSDCEIQPEWIVTAAHFLDEHADYAVACGRRRERFPEQSIYNQLCDIEWNTPVGDAFACGGDALIRVEAYKQVNGYRDDLIAGEEPEMCFRLRAKDWKIKRLDAEMTLHDAAMIKFSQWWKRTTRTGYAFTLGSSIHGKSEERYWVKETQRIMLWGLFLPVFIVVLAFVNPLFLFLYLIYFVQIVRVGLKRRDLGTIKFKWAASVVLGKIPEAIGLINCLLDRLRNITPNIIEYK